MVKVRMEFKERLKAYRKAAGLTQDELGRRIGISNRAVSAFENGVILPSLKTARAIADVLDVKLDDLYPSDE